MTSEAVLDPVFLASMTLFAGLPRPALADVMRCTHTYHLAKEERIFQQGDPAENAHAVIAGHVRISQSGSDGARVVMRFIGPGEMFGTVALFTDRRYPAEAVALDDSLVVRWSEADLLELIRRHPTIALNIVKIIGQRLKEAQERVRELGTQRAERRVAHALLRLARQAGKDMDNGMQIDFVLTRQHIAELSGVTLHTVSRILTAWEKLTWVITSRQRVTLRNLVEIERIAEDSWA